jgi:hypothetical protein
MATCEWVMWADMDDILENGANIRKDLEAMPAKVDVLAAPYDIKDDDVVVLRERVIRKDAYRWINPIHECLDIPKDHKRCDANTWQLVHRAMGDRKGNDERNVRILESIENPTGSQRFHLTLSYAALDRLEDAVRLGAEILQEKPEDMGKAEIYQICFTLADLCQEPNQKAQLMFQALMSDPTRREAYGELAMSYICAGKPEEARAMVRAMKALPMPEPAPWNIRRKFYGYQEPLLEGMTLRRLGQMEAADILERNYFKRNGAKISLVHATRGRPLMAAQSRRKWLDKAANPEAIEHIFAFDIDDESCGLLTTHRHVWCAPGSGPVAAWNAAAKVSCGEVLIQLSDDWEPPMHWDTAILHAIGPTDAPKVLAVSDGHRKDQLLCMAILTRSRYKQQGFMFHPEFFSMYSDNWFSKQAFEDGVVVDARESITFEHLHPCFGKGENDETYARSNAPYRYATGEGIMKRLEAGQKVSADMEGWFDYRDLYDTIAEILPDGGSFVEVGCYKGQSICYLHDRLEDTGKTVDLEVVDTFEGDDDCGRGNFLEDFRANSGLRKICPMVGDSAKSASEWDDESLDGVFIDAAHDYENAKADIEAWRGKVKPKGIFAGHDADSPDVQRALKDAGIDWLQVGRCWIQKPQQENPTDSGT